MWWNFLDFTDIEFDCIKLDYIYSIFLKIERDWKFLLIRQFKSWNIFGHKFCFEICFNLPLINYLLHGSLVQYSLIFDSFLKFCFTRLKTREINRETWGICKIFSYCIRYHAIASTFWRGFWGRIGVFSVSTWSTYILCSKYNWVSTLV